MYSNNWIKISREPARSTYIFEVALIAYDISFTRLMANYFPFYRVYSSSICKFLRLKVVDKKIPECIQRLYRKVSWVRLIAKILRMKIRKLESNDVEFSHLHFKKKSLGEYR